MKENSREDRINNAYCFLNSMHSDFRTGLYYKEDLENLEHILSDYKRVLKENEELKEDRKNNNEMIALAQNKILNYMSGYEDGKKHKMTAVAQVVENQQYYIVRKQMEKYEELIKRLKKENEELNLKYYMLYTGKNENLKAQEVKIKSQVIPVQTVKDKIEEELPLTIVGGRRSKKTLEYGIKLGRRQVLQELLEGRK